ncbi:MAG: beta-eliminating lyase-related protein [Burkholderiaceae bacterium]
MEQTHNFGGGSVWPVELLAAVGARAREHGLAVHMDGARLLNAVRATGRPALDFCRSVDSVWLDFTKGLGAPLGAVLAGDREFIAAARRYKHLFGGAMRQAGIAAAACLYALDHHVERLDEDHANAQRLAAGLAAVRGLRLVHGAPQTNIVFFEVDKGSFDAAGFAARCLERGLRFSAIAGRVRAVTHLDVGRTGIEEAIRIVTDVMDAAGSRLAD